MLSQKQTNDSQLATTLLLKQYSKTDYNTLRELLLFWQVMTHLLLSDQDKGALLFVCFYWRLSFLPVPRILFPPQPHGDCHLLKSDNAIFLFACSSARGGWLSLIRRQHPLSCCKSWPITSTLGLITPSIQRTELLLSTGVFQRLQRTCNLQHPTNMADTYRAAMHITVGR